MSAPDSARCCMAQGCGVVVGTSHVMCPQHWRLVPAPLRSDVWKHYRPGAPNKKYQVACDAAVKAVLDAEVARAGAKLLGDSDDVAPDTTAASHGERVRRERAPCRRIVPPATAAPAAPANVVDMSSRRVADVVPIACCSCRQLLIVTRDARGRLIEARSKGQTATAECGGCGARHELHSEQGTGVIVARRVLL